MNRRLENFITQTFLKLGLALAKQKTEKPLLMFANTLTNLLWLILRNEKQIIYNNLEIAFGDSISAVRKKQIAYNVLQNLSLTSAELLRLYYLEPSQITKMVESVEGWELIEQSRAKGKGLLMLGLHFGNWEIPAFYLSQKGIQTAGFAQTLHDPISNQLLNQIRAKFGVKVIKPNSPFLSIVTQTLNNNGAVGIVADQYAGPKGMVIPFMGKPAYTYTGPAVLHLKFNVDLLIIYSLRIQPFKYKLIIEPIKNYPELSDDRDANIKNILCAISDQIATIIKTYPDFWLWTHKRWKTP